MRIIISGSTGLIGTRLVDRLLKDKHVVYRLVRTKTSYQPDNCTDILWDPSTKTVDEKELSKIEQVDFAVNLAGFSIGAKRWNSKVKQEILQSRIQATEFFIELINQFNLKPKGFLSASAIGVYGNTGELMTDEDSKPGSDFLSDVCVTWEKTASSFGQNVTYLRSGIVLSKDGGVLKKQLGLFKTGLGGVLANGKQWMSWISLNDEVRAIDYCMNHSIFGPVNLTNPNPVTNYQFTKALGKALGRPTIFTVPQAPLKLILGAEMTEQLLLTSQKISPKVLTSGNFKFENDNLDDFLEAEFN